MVCGPAFAMAIISWHTSLHCDTCILLTWTPPKSMLCGQHWFSKARPTRVYDLNLTRDKWKGIEYEKNRLKYVYFVIYMYTYILRKVVCLFDLFVTFRSLKSRHPSTAFFVPWKALDGYRCMEVVSWHLDQWCGGYWVLNNFVIKSSINTKRIFKGNWLHSLYCWKALEE